MFKKIIAWHVLKHASYNKRSIICKFLAIWNHVIKIKSNYIGNYKLIVKLIFKKLGWMKNTSSE